MNPLIAQQQYLTFAQDQLTLAAGGQPAASLALYGVGRVAALATAMPGKRALGDIGVATATYQAALAADPNNFRASNELGVILGNCGRLEAARDVFRQSLAACPQSVTWRNLATVHQRLGETQLAQAALTNAGPMTPENMLPVNIAWVDPASFSRAPLADGSSTPPSVNLAPTAAKPPAAGNVETARTPSTNRTR